jgi:hypothetical protein
MGSLILIAHAEHYTPAFIFSKGTPSFAIGNLLFWDSTHLLSWNQDLPLSSTSVGLFLHSLHEVKSYHNWVLLHLLCCRWCEPETDAVNTSVRPLLLLSRMKAIVRKLLMSFFVNRCCIWNRTIRKFHLILQKMSCSDSVKHAWCEIRTEAADFS